MRPSHSLVNPGRLAVRLRTDVSCAGIRLTHFRVHLPRGTDSSVLNRRGCVVDASRTARVVIVVQPRRELRTSAMQNIPSRAHRRQSPHQTAPSCGPWIHAGLKFRAPPSLLADPCRFHNSGTASWYAIGWSQLAQPFPSLPQTSQPPQLR